MISTGVPGVPLILVVEDEPLSRDVLVDTLQENGYTTITAATGAEAWRLITDYRSRIDAILLDRLLPDMDTLSLLFKLKVDDGLKHVPVIIQTSMSDEKDIADGLKAGAYYYLIKPVPSATLLAIIRSAVKEHRDYLGLQKSLQQSLGIFKHLLQADFWFCTQAEARNLAALAARVAPDPERVILGLTELMLNAVEHGNLAITYAEKSSLIESNTLDLEIARRLQLPEFSSRRAHIRIANESNALHFVITDQGSGFDWRPYLELSPSRAFDTHGRGIAMSRLLSFDNIAYHGCGNEVVATVCQ